MKKQILSIITVSTLIWSCSKENISPNDISSAEQPSVVNGRLQFNSIDGFGSYLQSIKTLPLQSSNARKEFLSYYEIQQKTASQSNARTSNDVEEIVVTDTTYIPNSYLASVINEKREVGIGNDSIYKFGSDFTFVYLEADTAYISQFYKDFADKQIVVNAGELLIYKNKIRVAKTVQSLLSDSISVATNSANARIEKNIEQTAHFNHNEKVSGQVYSSNYFFYSCIGAKTFAQRKVRKRFLWWSWDSWTDLWIGEMSFTFSGASEIAKSKCKGCGTGGFGGSYFTYTEPKRGDKEVNKVFADLYGFNLPSIMLTDINSTHYGIHNGVRREVKVTGNLY